MDFCHSMAEEERHVTIDKNSVVIFTPHFVGKDSFSYKILD